MDTIAAENRSAVLTAAELEGADLFGCVILAVRAEKAQKAELARWARSVLDSSAEEKRVIL